MTSGYQSRSEQESAAEDRLTFLHDDLLISILSFLPVKQRVAVSAVCSRFRRLLSSIPRLDALRLHVGRPSGDVDNSQQFTFPRAALIRQCHIVFRDVPCSSERLQQLLAEAGVQDLALEASGKRWWNLSGRETCGFFGIKSLRSVSLHRIAVGRSFDGGGHLPAVAFTHLTSLKMKFCIIYQIDFLRAFLPLCPFLETLHFICCFECCTSNMSIHSASIKHLVLLHKSPWIPTIDVRCPNLESLAVDVAAELLIEAPKVRNASLLLGLDQPADSPDALTLTKLLGGAFRSGAAWLMLNSSTTPNILAAENGIDRFIHPKYKEDVIIFNFDFNLKDRSSTMILTQLLKKCNNCHTKFNIRADSMRIQSTNEDDRLLYDSAEVELIDLQIKMPEKTFEVFLSNQKEMKDGLKRVALQKPKCRTSRKQFNNISASDEFLVKVSSSINNCIEIKF